MVPALARRHAPPGADRDRPPRSLLIVHGPAVPADRVHRRRRVGAAAGALRARGRRRDPEPSSRPGRPRRCGRGRRRRSRAARRPAPTRGSWSGSTASRAVAPPEQAGGYLADRRRAGAARRCRTPPSGCVEDVRAVDAPFPVQVGGETAAFVDQQTSLGDSLPLALAILATTTLVILFLMTGSVVLPVKALIMNLLTLSAAFGLLVLIFQDGRLEGLLAYESQGRWRRRSRSCCSASRSGSRPTTACSCSRGSRRRATRASASASRWPSAWSAPGRIVTYAALLFCIAIGAFATSEIVFIKEVGRRHGAGGADRGSEDRLLDGGNGSVEPGDELGALCGRVDALAALVARLGASLDEAPPLKPLQKARDARGGRAAHFGDVTLDGAGVLPARGSRARNSAPA